ncbi:MAG: uL22 family ribosomal protein [Candidatus Aenigmatarchaeota archaeon]
MPYTFEPEQPHAKAFGQNLRISAKDAVKLSAVVRGKKLTVAKRLLQDLVAGQRSLKGKYYTKAAVSMLRLLTSCEANARSLGLDEKRLFVHAAATHGTHMRRARRKLAFGSRMKSTNLEVMLIERGKAKSEIAADESKTLPAEMQKAKGESKQ